MSQRLAGRIIGGLRVASRALHSRNYRLFFSGQAVSLVGVWMQRVAIGWLVYRLTHSSFLLGAVAFAGQIPTFIMAPVAGVLVDRWNRHRILIVTQTCSMIQAGVLAALVMANVVTIWEIFFLSAVLGLINAFDITARQSLVVDLIDHADDLGNAIALNSSMVNGARLVGPALAGLLIAATGEGVCFLINAVTYLPVIAALLAIRLRRRPGGGAHASMLRQLREGLVYALSAGPIREVLALVAIISLFGLPHIALMPVFAEDILGGSAGTLGFLLGASGCGAMIGALYLTTRSGIRGLDRCMTYAAAAFGGALVFFSQSRNVWLSLFLVGLMGFGMMMVVAASNTVLQTVVHDDKRGRVMSLFTMCFMGASPMGSLIAGSLAHRIGAPTTFTITGTLCLLGAWHFGSRLPALRARMKAHYEEQRLVRGIDPGLT